MTRTVIESLGPAYWRAGLADPHLHWKRGRSAWEMAVAWESQSDSESGLPPEVETVLAKHPRFHGARLLIGVVEHQVILDDPRRPSQNDLWGVLITNTGHVSMSVEAKAGEDFDKRLGDWLREESEGKERRLNFLCRQLAINERPSLSLRYQLFHRAASAVLEAQRWHFPIALMLIQSFAESKTSWQDFADFAAVFRLDAKRNSVIGPWRLEGIDLFLGWVDSTKADDAIAASAI